MKIYKTLSIITGLFATPLSADTIVLKTGQKYEGKVISEDATSYLVSIQVTKSIKDERKFLKDNVAEIIKESPVEKDYEALGSLIPTPDRLTAKNYEDRISRAKAFIEKYGQTDQGKKVQTDIAILMSEHATISAGGTKINGRLISADELKMNTYEVDAMIISSDIVRFAQQGTNHLALRKWDTLKQDYPNSEAYIKSVPAVTRILQIYKSQLEKELSTVDHRMEKREKIVMSLDDADRSRAEGTIMQKKSSYEDLIEKEKKEMKTRWLTIDTFHADALKNNHRNAESELKSLARIDSSKHKLAGPNQRGAWEALASGELEMVAKHLKELKSMKLGDKYTGPIMTMLSEKEAAVEMAAEKMAEKERMEKEKAKMAAKEDEMENKKKKGRKKKK